MKFKALSHYGFVMLFCMALFVPSVHVNANEACEGRKLVILGDSLVAGYGLGPGESYPDKLSEALDNDLRGLEIVNAGVSGDTTGGGLARLDWSVGQDTKAVILELGANDGMRGIPLEQIRNNLDQIIARLKDREISILMMGMLAPPNMGSEYGDGFREIYTALSKHHDVPLYPFFLDGVAAEPSLNLDDGIHPNKAGIAILVQNTLPKVKKLIEAACQS